MPYDFKWTKFYDSATDFISTGEDLELAEKELIICSTVIDKNNYSILTSRQLITKNEGQLKTGYIQGATDKLYGDFKGNKDNDFTFGQVELQNENNLNYFIETGKASMIMIQGVRTLIGITQIPNKQDDDI